MGDKIDAIVDYFSLYTLRISSIKKDFKIDLNHYNSQSSLGGGKYKKPEKIKTVHWDKIKVYKFT